MQVCICIPVCTHAHVYEDQRSTLDVISYVLSTLVFLFVSVFRRGSHFIALAALELAM